MALTAYSLKVDKGLKNKSLKRVMILGPENREDRLDRSPNKLTTRLKKNSIFRQIALEIITNWFKTIWYLVNHARFNSGVEKKTFSKKDQDLEKQGVTQDLILHNIQG